MRIYILLITTFLTNESISSQCTLNNSGGNYNNAMASSGNISIDNVLNSEKNKLEEFFNVKVDLKIVSGSNGLAKRSCRNDNCNGTIELGNHLLINEFKKQGFVTKNALGRNMVIAVMAHEYAHIFQYVHPEFKFKNAVIQEIHADLLAGWYLAQYLMKEHGITREGGFLRSRNLSKEEFVEKSRSIRHIMADLQIAFGWMGDEEYWSPQHHGDFHTRCCAFMETWRCMQGQPVQLHCDNYSKWLEQSVWLAEQKYHSEMHRK